MSGQQVQDKQKIIPHLWFDKEAQEAAEFYTQIFPESKVTNINQIHNTPSGDCDIVSFNVCGFKFMATSAGPSFKPNPSISFMVNFDPSRMDNAEEKLNEIWEALSDGGRVAMLLDKYPFSERYGWIEDKYGVSWQLILTDPEGEDRPFIIPSLLFVNLEGEEAEEATDFYISVFKDFPSANPEQTKRGLMARYPAGMEPNKEGAVMFTDFKILGQWFAAMDGSSKMHNFKFNEAVSLIVNCDTQEEIDYYWERLSEVPEAEQCGWLKDKYGVSWQIVPEVLSEMLASSDKDVVDRVTKAFLQMKRFDIKKLKNAYQNNKVV